MHAIKLLAFIARAPRETLFVFLALFSAVLMEQSDKSIVLCVTESGAAAVDGSRVECDPGDGGRFRRTHPLQGALVGRKESPQAARTRVGATLLLHDR